MHYSSVVITINYAVAPSIIHFQNNQQLLMLVRKYKEADSQAIADIYNESIVQGGITMDTSLKNAEDIRSLVKKFNSREIMLVAQEGEQVIGWGVIKSYSDRWGYRVCCETSTYISLKETGKGYGSQLQKELLEQVAELGYHHVVAKIMASNQGSINFHKRFGFEVVGVQKEIGFMEGSWHDVMIMQLILPHVGAS